MRPIAEQVHNWLCHRDRMTAADLELFEGRDDPMKECLGDCEHNVNSINAEFWVWRALRKHIDR